MHGADERDGPGHRRRVHDLGAASGSRWTTADLDRAFEAPAGDPLRLTLESALLDGPLTAYASGVRGAVDAYLPLENGLAVMSRHAQQHGYTGLILFLDELILWLQAHMSNQEKVNSEVSKLVKLIESGDTGRPVPIVSFISRQRNLSQLVGEDVVGADVKNLEQAVQYLAGRFKVVTLADQNLLEIAYQIAGDKIEAALYTPTKVERTKAVNALKEEVKTAILEKHPEADKFAISQAFDYLQKKAFRISILDRQKRCDGRGYHAGRRPPGRAGPRRRGSTRAGRTAPRSATARPHAPAHRRSGSRR